MDIFGRFKTIVKNYISQNGIVRGILNMNGNRIMNLGEPEDRSDAVTKEFLKNKTVDKDYVDNKIIISDCVELIKKNNGYENITNLDNEEFVDPDDVQKGKVKTANYIKIDKTKEAILLDYSLKQPYFFVSLERGPQWLKYNLCLKFFLGGEVVLTTSSEHLPSINITADRFQLTTSINNIELNQLFF